MLQELLNLGLVPIGEDDSRFAKVEEAAHALVETLTNKPSLLIPAALVAIDSDIAENEPLLATVEEFVISKWNNLRNVHTNRPRTLLRSVLIHALDVVCEEDPEAAGVVWNIAISPVNHGQARLGREAEVIRKFLAHLGEMVELEAVSQLDTAEPVPRKRKRLKMKQLDSDFSNVTEEELAEHIRSLNQLVSDSMKHIEEVRTEILESEQAVKTRLDVLWWLEARYSPSLRIGYRDLACPAALLAMAHDLTQLVPALAPSSVTYLLGEAAATLTEKTWDPHPRSLEVFLSELAGQGTVLGGLFTKSEAYEGRVPLTEVLAEACEGNYIEPEDLRSRTGLDPLLSITPQQFTMWVFRDLQARRLVEGLEDAGLQS